MSNKPLVVVTGASSGIGAAVARAFSREARPLLLLARRISPLEALDLPNTICAAVDVTDQDAVCAAVAAAESRFGTADCLVNSAGLMLLGETPDQRPNELERMLDVNVIGTMNVIHCVLPGMMRQRRGTIFNISSIAGRQSFPFHAGYCASKFAVHGLSASLGMDLGRHNIRVTTISPGVVDTPLLDQTTSATAKAMFSEWVETLDSVLHPENVAQTICFAYGQPQAVCIREIFITSTSQTS